MVSAEDVISLLQLLDAEGVVVWVVGGWGIDALLCEQTRPHKDLDLLMLLEDVARMCALLASKGYALKEIWSENRWAIDGRGLPTLTAFVLSAANGHELDFHALRMDERGYGIPEWDTEAGFFFTRDDPSATGAINGYPIRCLTPAKQVQCHTGYELPEKQIPDLLLLQEKFGLELPQAHSALGDREKRARINR